MKKRILLVARHGLNEAQMPTLQKMFGNFELVPYNRPVEKPEEVVRDYRRGGFDDLIAIAPFPILDGMAKAGIAPLWSDAIVVPHHEEWDWEVNGRYYRFLRFKRVKQLVQVLEDLPNKEAAKRHSNDKPAQPTNGGNGKRILWVCKWDMNLIQVPALQRLYGQDVQVVPYLSFSNAKRIKGDYQQGMYDDMIAVVPQAVMIHMSAEEGLQPLWSDAKQVKPGEAFDWEVNGRRFYFLGYKRVVRCEMEYESLGPNAERCD